MQDYTNSRYRYMLFKGNSYRRYIPEEEGQTVKQNAFEPFINDTPAHGTYGGLLFNPKWRVRREQILQRDSNKCLICKGSVRLQVHHRQYQFVVRENKFKLPWDYSEHLLITLCESCHNRGHSKYKVPIVHI